MAKSAEETRSYPDALMFFVEKCRNIAASGLPVAFKSENLAENGISVWFRFHWGASFKSYGEKVTVTLTPTAAGTDINIHSECGMPTQLMDGGKNRQNIERLFAYLESGRQTVSAPQGQEYVFCASCGKKNIRSAKFCSACGNRIEPLI